MRFFSTALLVIVSLCGVHAQSDSSDPLSPVEEVYLAKDDGTGHAGEPITEFAINDIPIYCVVILKSSESSAVRMNFVAMSVPGVKANTKVVATSYTTREGENRVNFTGRPHGKWTSGRYRVEIFVNDKLVSNIEFLIKGPMPAKDLLPRFKPQSKATTATKRNKP